ncbi:MAG: hypothetical protein AAF984_09435 [Verrucomicrobiota bacterium]
MRVTSNLYPEVFKSQVNYLRERQLLYQNQITTGVSVSKSSDNPVAFQMSQKIAADQSARVGYLSTSGEVTSLMESNYQAMSDLMQGLSRLSELTIKGNNALDSEALQAIGQETDSLVQQIVAIANRQHDGNYLFGGTTNQPPIDESGSPAYAFNSGNTTSTVTTAKINDGPAVTTGIVAGDDDMTDGFDGFLVNGTVNTLTVIQDIRDTFLAGNAVTSTQIQNMNNTIDLASEFVGITSAKLSAFDLNERVLQENIRSAAARIDGQTGVNMTDAITELNRTQSHYQAALQSGARILNITLLNYLR